MLLATCNCKSVEIELAGPPIAATSCHCKDCREGAAKVEALPGAPVLHDEQGGIPFVLFRRDQVRVAKGQDRLAKLRVNPESPDRVYASCCNSGLMMGLPDFLHWVPVHAACLNGRAPATEMHMNLKSHVAEGARAPVGVVASNGVPARLVFRLLRAKARMLLGIGPTLS